MGENLDFIEELFMNEKVDFYENGKFKKSFKNNFRQIYW